MNDRHVINARLSLWALFQNSEISLFETNIRFMGSLLASYALTGDVMFRDKAAQLGERMLPAFQTETGIPHSLINLHTGVSAAFRCHITRRRSCRRADAPKPARRRCTSGINLARPGKKKPAHLLYRRMKRGYIIS